jgi:ABC-type phosphate/phosphonate transport system substrate-binding protein
MTARIASLGCFAVLAVAIGARAADPQSDGAVIPIRIGASSALVEAEVNATDARAALVVWSEALSRGTGIRILHTPEVMSPPELLFQRVRQGELDVFACTIREYVRMVSYTDPGLVFIDQSYLSGGEEYLILVHADSEIRNVSDLRGHSLSVYSGNAMILASDWLDTVLAELNLGPAASFFKQITQNPKAARAVLPVFFRQADACLVNRSALEVLIEMNPQISSKLRVLDGSPKMVPTLVAVHRNCSQLQKDRLRFAMTSMNNNPSGQQILRLFGSRGLSASTPAILASAIEVVKTSNRIRPGAGVGKK